MIKKTTLCLLAFTTLAFYAKAQSCPPVDVPDILFQDSDGDGIDGDKTRAVFLDATYGDDSWAGTMSQPVKTLEKAVQLAAGAHKDVYAAKGNYVLSSTLVLTGGVSLYGLYAGKPSWQRNLSNTTYIGGQPLSPAIRIQNAL